MKIFMAWVKQIWDYTPEYMAIGWLLINISVLMLAGAYDIVTGQGPLLVRGVLCAIVIQMLLAIVAGVVAIIYGAYKNFKQFQEAYYRNIIDHLKKD